MESENIIGMATRTLKDSEETTTEPEASTSWHIALRDAGITFALVVIPTVMVTQPTSWADMCAFDHVGVPVLSAIEMFFVSLAVRYKVVVPTKK